MGSHIEFRIGDRGNQRAGLHVPQRGTLLLFAGIAGVLLSAGLTLSFLLNYVSAAALIAGILYLVAVGGAGLVLSGDMRPLVSWGFRLLAPLPVALFVWWGLTLLGL